MIDKLLDRINEYKIKSIKSRTKHLEKYHEAKAQEIKVKTKLEKLKPKSISKRPGQQEKSSILDNLADFGEGCARASEHMNNSLWVNQEK